MSCRTFSPSRVAVALAIAAMVAAVRAEEPACLEIDTSNVEVLREPCKDPALACSHDSGCMCVSASARHTRTQTRDAAAEPKTRKTARFTHPRSPSSTNEPHPKKTYTHAAVLKKSSALLLFFYYNFFFTSGAKVKTESKSKHHGSRRATSLPCSSET